MDLDLSTWVPPVLVLLSILVLVLTLERCSNSTYTYVLIWWLGSIIYALLMNEIPSTSYPMSFSILVTFLILAVPGTVGHFSKVELNPGTQHVSLSSNRVIGLCNMLNIWSVVLGSLLIGGSATYYLKLGEPLVVLIVEILVYGRKSLSVNHIKNGAISIILLTVFHYTALCLTPPREKSVYFFSHSTVIASISIISVATKVVLGARSANIDEANTDHGVSSNRAQHMDLFLYRSSVGFYIVLVSSVIVLLVDREVVYEMYGVMPTLILMAITQNVYNFASLVVNLRKLVGEYVNGKIIKRTLVLIALTLSARQTTDAIRLSVSIQQPRENLLLFGAMGRHNFGDLLMPEVFIKNLEALCGYDGIWSKYNVYFVDILPRKMAEHGGRDVRGITEFMTNSTRTNVVHIGGETTSCTIQCALYFIKPDRNLPVLSSETWKTFSNSPETTLAYIVPKSLFTNPGIFITNTIGGVNSRSARASGILNGFEYVSTRDFPQDKGSNFTSVPDSVITIRDLFEDRIIAHAPEFSTHEYIAVQFREGTNTAVIAEQLISIINQTGWDVVMFRAGAAPGHDSLTTYNRVLQLIQSGGYGTKARIFIGLDIWDITSLIAHSNLVISTSLHVRIIAFAFSVPRITFDCGRKHSIMIAYWDYGAIECQLGPAQIGHLSEAARESLNCDHLRNPAHAERAAELYRAAFRNMISHLDSCPEDTSAN